MARPGNPLRRAVDVYRSAGLSELITQTITLVGYTPARWYYDWHATNVLDRNWDLLVILDACRPDALAAVSDEYDFLPGTIPTIVTTGAGTDMWVARTFTDDHRDELADVTYLTANAVADTILRPGTDDHYKDRGPSGDMRTAFDEYVPLFDVATDDETGVVHPETMTDYLIDYWRRRSPDRLIAHYIQPHWPIVAAGHDHVPDNGNEAYAAAERGEVSRADMWAAYLDNLRLALDAVAEALDNVDAQRVVLSADHGDRLGEHGEWGHGCNYRAVTRVVPWVECSATDTGRRSPAVDWSADEHTELHEHLAALGYRQERE